VGGTIAEVHYFYSFGGEPFEGYSREPYLIRGRAQDYVLDLPPGTKVRINVNPRSPSQSFLIGP